MISLLLLPAFNIPGSHILSTPNFFFSNRTSDWEAEWFSLHLKHESKCVLHCLLQELIVNFGLATSYGKVTVRHSRHGKACSACSLVSIKTISLTGSKLPPSIPPLRLHQAFAGPFPVVYRTYELPQRHKRSGLDILWVLGYSGKLWIIAGQGQSLREDVYQKTGLIVALHLSIGRIGLLRRALSTIHDEQNERVTVSFALTSS